MNESHARFKRTEIHQKSVWRVVTRLLGLPPVRCNASGSGTIRTCTSPARLPRTTQRGPETICVEGEGGRDFGQDHAPAQRLRRLRRLREDISESGHYYKGGTWLQIYHNIIQSHHAALSVSNAVGAQGLTTQCFKQRLRQVAERMPAAHRTCV